MMRPVVAFVMGLSVVISTEAHARAAQSTKPLPGAWESITDKLWKQIPDYQHDPKWYNRRVGTIHVDNTNGALYVMLCAKWGTWKSSDQGETWTQADAKALGRQVDNRGVCANPLTGDFVLFRVNGGPPTQSAIVLGHGKRWLPVPSGVGDGWRCGMADWSQSPPRTLVAIRHHHDGLYLTRDAGTSWTELPDKGDYGFAMLDANTIFITRLNLPAGQKVSKWKAKSLPKDILLTTDQCRTFTKFGRFTPRSETPTRYGDDLFWIAAEGVMVTRDRGWSWRVMGTPVKDLKYGPFFGRNEKETVVVSKQGFHRTGDAGQHWTKLADMMVPEGQKIELAHAGWDPIHNVIYVGFLGDDVYRCRLGTR